MACPKISPSVKPLQPLLCTKFRMWVTQSSKFLAGLWYFFAKSASSAARCSKYICIVLLKWSVPFISLSFSDCLFQYLSPISRCYLTEKEVYEVLPYFLVQFVVKFTENGEIAVDICLHHVLEDVIHFVELALLCCRLATSLCHVCKN